VDRTFEILLEQGCPRGVRPLGEEGECSEQNKCVANRKDRVAWQATEHFEIYFDPIQGKTVEGERDRIDLNKWVSKKKKIHDDAPPREAGGAAEVKYKYTILVDGCAEPLDPPIFIQR
jgi:hypothetical protein